MPDLIAVMKTSSRTTAWLIPWLCGIALTGHTTFLTAQSAPPAGLTDIPAEALTAELPNINNSSERWYQVEVTLFLHRFHDPEEEVWQGADSLTASPAGTTRLLSLTELLALPQWTEAESESGFEPEPELQAGQERVPEPLFNGPEPAHQSDFRIPDPSTDGFIALLPEDWNFTETNASLQRSPNYRVLYHSAWRQPMRLANATQDMVIQAGQQVGNRYELEGTLRFYFNSRRDRIIMDNQLLFNTWDENSRPAATSASVATETSTMDVVHSIPVMTTRELRSNEFHYLDHPVVGALVEVFPYELEASE